MFIKKSTHEKIVEDLHYSYGRKEYYLEQKVKQLQRDNENLKTRLNRAVDLLASKEQRLIDAVAPKEVARPSRSESITRKIQSYSTPSKQADITDDSSTTNAVLISALLNHEDTASSSYSSNASYQPSCSSYSSDSSSSYDSSSSSSCDYSSSSFD